MLASGNALAPATAPAAPKMARRQLGSALLGGAAKLLALCPRANFHVDLAAWGQRGLNLYCVNPLLAKQTHEDTTIGGMADRSWIPHFVDEYTGVDFQWA